MSDFLAMGGYGAFVWPAYGLTALVMLWILATSWHALRGRRSDLQRLEADLPARASRAREGRPGERRT